MLLVDDDDAVREVVHALLTGSGYQVVSAPDGEAGLRLLRADDGTLALLIADYAMPGMNGLDLIRAARALRPDLPVLLVSGYARTEAVREIAGLGGSDFLRKPFRARELLARVEELAGGLA